MPRACRVDRYIVSYDRPLPFQRPRPCAVELHVHGYRSSEREPPRRKAVASEEQQGADGSNKREPPRDKPVASARVRMILFQLAQVVVKIANPHLICQPLGERWQSVPSHLAPESRLPSGFGVCHKICCNHPPSRVNLPPSHQVDGVPFFAKPGFYRPALDTMRELLLKAVRNETLAPGARSRSRRPSVCG